MMKNKRKKQNSKRTRFKNIQYRSVIFFFIIFGGSAISYVKGDKICGFITDVFLSSTAKIGFSCDNVYIVGIKHIKEEEVKNHIHFKKQDSIFKYSSREIFDSLKEHVWLKDIIVHKNFPNTLTIKILEKEEKVVLLEGNKLFFIEGDGNKICETPNKPKNLLMISGKGSNARFSEIIKVMDKYESINQKVTMFNLVRERRWNVIFGNLTVKFPEVDVKESLDILNHLMSIQGIMGASVIDLRIPGKIIIKGLQKNQKLV